MAGESITTLEPEAHMALGSLHLLVGAATAPRADVRTTTIIKTLGPQLLTKLRTLARRDLSAVEDVSQLSHLLDQYRQIAIVLERLLGLQQKMEEKAQQIKPRPRLVGLLGTPAQIESVLEEIEDTIENLEIATNPEVHAGLERLIAEVKPS
jgi:hypothetical protein